MKYTTLVSKDKKFNIIHRSGFFFLPIIEDDSGLVNIHKFTSTEQTADYFVDNGILPLIAEDNGYQVSNKNYLVELLEWRLS